MNSKISNKISNLNVILTILIVLLHSNCMSYASSDSFLYSQMNFIQKVFNVICDISVPSFFALSIYLFYLKFDYKLFFSKIKSRFYTLVIPYLIWSILFFILFIIIDKINVVDMKNLAIEPLDYSIMGIIKSILLSSYNGQLWYVRVLFEFSIISPILYYLIKKIRIYNLLIILGFFVLNMIFKVSYSGFFYWLPLVYGIAFFTVNKEFSFYEKKENRYLIFIIYSVLFILDVFLRNNYYITFLYRMFVPFFVLALLYGNNIFTKTKFKIAKYCFFIYCVHFNFVNIFKSILVSIIGNSAIMMIILPFITCFFTIIILYLVALIFNKLFPKIMKIVSGNRV